MTDFIPCWSNFEATRNWYYISYRINLDNSKHKPSTDESLNSDEEQWNCMRNHKFFTFKLTRRLGWHKAQEKFKLYWNLYARYSRASEFKFSPQIQLRDNLKHVLTFILGGHKQGLLGWHQDRNMMQEYSMKAAANSLQILDSEESETLDDWSDRTSKHAGTWHLPSIEL